MLGLFLDGMWGYEFLNKLLRTRRSEIAFVVLRSSPTVRELEKYVKDHGLQVLRISDINSKDTLDLVNLYDCRLYISVSYDQIFKAEPWFSSERRIINFHAGYLPYYRGRNVLNWAIINGERSVGLTAHYIDRGIDTGPILVQKVLSVEARDNYRDVLHKTLPKVFPILNRAIELHDSGTFRPRIQPQLAKYFSYCRRRGPGDERIDWGADAITVDRLVRAITYPSHGARCRISDTDGEVIILDTRITGFRRNLKEDIGKVTLDRAGFFAVTCAIGTLSLYNYQSSHRLTPGMRLV